MKKALLLLIFFFAFTAFVCAQEIYPQSTPSKDEKPEKGVHGYVLARLIFTAEGKITDVKILNHPTREMRDIVNGAIQKIKFKPALRNGQPVSVRMVMEFNVQLLESETINLREALKGLFRFLSHDSIDALTKELESNITSSISYDLWAIERERMGAQSLPDKERTEYQKLEDEAFKKLVDPMKKRAEQAKSNIVKNANDVKEQTIFISLLYEGVDALSKEKRARFIDLHNQAMNLGLRQALQK